MSKKEFLKGLEEALLEQMDISQAAPHIRYYQEYIENEVRNGRDEHEVVKSLQNPRLVAKNIVNNSKSANKYKSDVYDSQNDSKMYNQHQESNAFGRGNRSPISFSINGKPINSLFLKIVLMVVTVILVVLVLVILGGIIWILTKFVLPVVIIGGVIYALVKLIKNRL